MLQEIIDHANFPIVSALLLGVLTAISPCPLATNITATAFIAKNLAGKRKVLLSGLLYTSGLAFSYTGIALIIILGASKFHMARFLQGNGEKFVGPVMVIIGLIMLNVIRLDFLTKGNLTARLQDRFRYSGLSGSFFLGMLFALAFCPYSGALYFGILIPLSIKSAMGLTLPLFYALGAGSLVLFFTFLIAFSMQKVGKYFNAVQRVEKVMRVAAGLLFVLTGFYYILIYLKAIE